MGKKRRGEDVIDAVSSKCGGKYLQSKAAARKTAPAHPAIVIKVALSYRDVLHQKIKLHQNLSKHMFHA